MTKVAAAVVYAMGWPGWATAIFLLLDPWLFWTILTAGARGFGPVASGFRTSRREIWLTFDDGPDPRTTPAVLDLLDQHGAKATFFVIGDRVHRHPELAREIVRRGHGLGNHTASHPSASFWRHASRALALEIDDCSRALRLAGVPPSRYFRAPVGIKNPLLHRVLADRGMHLVAWTSRGYDRIFSPRVSARMLRKAIQPGHIVMLHEGGRDGTDLQVVQAVLKHLKEEKIAAVIPKHEALEF